MLSVMNQALWDLMPSSTPEEIELMRKDMQENMEIYVQENQEDMDRVFQTGQRAVELMQQRRQATRAQVTPDEEEDTYDWDLLDA